MIIKSEIEKLINEAANDLGYLIYDFSIYLKGENSKITVKLDCLAGISHRDCEAYSKRLDELLDDSEILSKYTLEISSPGLDRQLRSLDDLKRFIGAPVKIIYNVNDDRLTSKGNIMAIKENIIELNSENKLIQINYCNIADAYLDY